MIGQRYVKIHPDDDVIVCLAEVAAGEELAPGISARQPTPKGHKLALRAIAAGEPVRKYGAVIGRATAPIGPGEHVHVHNLKTALQTQESYAFSPAVSRDGVRSQGEGFMGYRRADGRVGVRNEIWILCTVGCVARTAERIAAEAQRRFAGRVDGVIALTHPFGCSQLGDDLAATRRILAALAAHPNAGGVLFLGLGCESNALDQLLAEASGLDRPRMRAFSAQGVPDELEAGLAAVEELVSVVEGDRREPCPLSDLVVGVKCGGSDGLSGLTANPLVGRLADEVVAAGGTVLMSEIPEVFGAERLLMARAADPQVFDAVGQLVNDFKAYFVAHGEPVSENPSPGNLEGGITTLEEKSLGAVQKAGTGVVTEVLRYGQRVSRRGVAVVEAPGADAVSTTALVAAGATLVLFTTGRGTPLGSPAPTLKIASNSGLASRKPSWIDVDAEPYLGAPEAAADALLAAVIETASGRPTRAEQNGEREIAIWKRGVTL
jgi:altronate hydrolase